ncbi:MAG: YicC family protein [Acidobacteria bacterium]|nr:YicC family protein [Acidobacteriota bacterium]
MIKSMTGFASLTREDERVTIGVTLRSVNHRYLDLQLRTPTALAELEPQLRALVQRHAGRGRVELSVQVQLRQPPPVQVEINEAFLSAIGTALGQARDRGLLQGALTPGDLLRFPQAFTIKEQSLDQDPALAAHVASMALKAIEEALVALDAMRTREGEFLAQDLNRRRAAVAEMVDGIARAAKDGEAALIARLGERVRELTSEFQLEPAAVAQEIVRTAARSDISEEVVRFRGHIGQWGILSESAEPCGRKLDFLLQEMNREVNTMGSKADGLQVSELIVAAKAELEKMREQVQNVE